MEHNTEGRNQETEKELAQKITIKLSELNSLLKKAYDRDLMVDIRHDYVHEIPRKFDRTILSARIFQSIEVS